MSLLGSCWRCAVFPKALVGNWEDASFIGVTHERSESQTSSKCRPSNATGSGFSTLPAESWCSLLARFLASKGPRLISRWSSLARANIVIERSTPSTTTVRSRPAKPSRSSPAHIHERYDTPNNPATPSKPASCPLTTCVGGAFSTSIYCLCTFSTFFGLIFPAS